MPDVAHAQASRLSTAPVDVVKEFFDAETRGLRLTDEGWYKAGHFFVHPIPPPSKKEILIIDKTYSVWDHPKTIKTNTLRFTVVVTPIWRMDSAMRLSPPSLGYELYEAEDVIFGNEHWEFGPDKNLTEESGPPEWRFALSPAEIWITPDVAVRYVTDVRAKTTDPAIRKNADATLAVLAKLKE